jgi:hypothetical protein
VGDKVGVGVRVGVCVGVDVRVGVGFAVAVGIGVGNKVRVGVRVGVPVGVNVCVGAGVSIDIGVAGVGGTMNRAVPKATNRAPMIAASFCLFGLSSIIRPIRPTKARNTKTNPPTTNTLGTGVSGSPSNSSRMSFIYLILSQVKNTRRCRNS